MGGLLLAGIGLVLLFILRGKSARKKGAAGDSAQPGQQTDPFTNNQDLMSAHQNFMNQSMLHHHHHNMQQHNYNMNQMLHSLHHPDHSHCGAHNPGSFNNDTSTPSSDSSSFSDNSFSSDSTSSDSSSSASSSAD